MSARTWTAMAKRTERNARSKKKPTQVEVPRHKESLNVGRRHCGSLCLHPHLVVAMVLWQGHEVAAEMAQVGPGHVSAGSQVMQSLLELGTVYLYVTRRGPTPMLLGTELCTEALGPSLGQVAGDLGTVGAGVLDSQAAFVGEERREDTLFDGLGGLMKGVAGRRFSITSCLDLGGRDDKVDAVEPPKLGFKAVDDEGAVPRILVMSALPAVTAHLAVVQVVAYESALADPQAEVKV